MGQSGLPTEEGLPPNLWPQGGGGLWLWMSGRCGCPGRQRPRPLKADSRVLAQRPLPLDGWLYELLTKVGSQGRPSALLPGPQPRPRSASPRPGTPATTGRASEPRDQLEGLEVFRLDARPLLMGSEALWSWRCSLHPGRQVWGQVTHSSDRHLVQPGASPWLLSSSQQPWSGSRIARFTDEETEGSRARTADVAGLG